MAIKLKNTSDVGNMFMRALVYGQAGAGKTTLATTMPAPVIISAEAGLLSISGSNIPFVEISSISDLEEVYEWLTESSEANKFDSVVLDSISEVGEVVLAKEKKFNKDGRAAYGEMASKMGQVVRDFRDLPGKHVLMTAKLEKSQDEMGRMLYGPSMPGTQMTQKLPYFFDAVFAMRVEKDSDGNIQRALMCESDGLWQAKCRINGVEPWEAPDLGEIIRKIGGGV